MRGTVVVVGVEHVLAHGARTMTVKKWRPVRWRVGFVLRSLVVVLEAYFVPGDRPAFFFYQFL